MRSHPRTDKAILVYNADEQKLIAIFSTQTLVAKWIFGDEKYKFRNKIHYAVTKKVKIENSVFNFKIAIRYASQEQTDALGEEDQNIFGDYKPLPWNKIKGFDTSAMTLSALCSEKLTRYALEYKNKKISNLVCPK
jgi:hypothetical protein